jgi:protein SCO1/2
MMQRRKFLIGLYGFTAVAAIAAGWLYLDMGTRQGGAVTIGGPFSLVNGDEKRVSEADFKGKWLMVYFGYTYCPDACPTTLNSMAEMLARMGADADKIQPVFITVDPERDTPTVMKQYVEAFDPRIVGLTGSPEEIAAAEKVYRVYSKKVGEGANYLMDHTTVVYVMNPDYQFIGVVQADLPPAEMLEKMRKLMAVEG